MAAVHDAGAEPGKHDESRAGVAREVDLLRPRDCAGADEELAVCGEQSRVRPSDAGVRNVTSATGRPSTLERDGEPLEPCSVSSATITGTTPIVQTRSKASCSLNGPAIRRPR